MVMQGILFLTNMPLCAGAKSPVVIHLPADSLQIVFLANVNANFENCHCGEHPLGGLDRVITVVNQWRRQNPHLLLIDGGDFLNAYPYPALNRMILHLYRLLRPDMLSLGDQELQKGNIEFQDEIFNGAFRFLNSNISVGKFPLEKEMAIRLKSHNITILSYLDPSSFLWEKPAQNVQINMASFEQSYRRSLAAKNFRIVIFHGEQDRLKAFIKTHDKVHLILLAHAQVRTSKTNSLPYILGVGTDSEYLTRISLKFNSGKFYPELRVKSLPIELTIKPNSSARQIIEEFKTQSQR